MTILFVMRDPIERAWSAAVMHFARLRGRAIADVTDDEVLAFVGSDRNIARSDYMRTLDAWEGVFPPGAVHTEFFDSIVDEPVALLKRLGRVLGIESFDAASCVLRQPRNAAAAGILPSPRLRAGIVRLMEPQLDALARRFPDQVAQWRARQGQPAGVC